MVGHIGHMAADGQRPSPWSQGRRHDIPHYREARSPHHVTVPDLGKSVPLVVLARVALTLAHAMRFDYRKLGTQARQQYFHVASKALPNLASAYFFFLVSPVILSITQSPFGTGLLMHL